MSEATWVCTSPENLSGWQDMFDCTDPNFWAYMGIAIAICVSIIGAGM